MVALDKAPSDLDDEDLPEEPVLLTAAIALAKGLLGLAVVISNDALLALHRE